MQAARGYAADLIRWPTGGPHRELAKKFRALGVTSLVVMRAAVVHHGSAYRFGGGTVPAGHSGCLGPDQDTLPMGHRRLEWNTAEIATHETESQQRMLHCDIPSSTYTMYGA
jgi:hypothetical protein